MTKKDKKIINLMLRQLKSIRKELRDIRRDANIPKHRTKSIGGL